MTKGIRIKEQNTLSVDNSQSLFRSQTHCKYAVAEPHILNVLYMFNYCYGVSHFGNTTQQLCAYARAYTDLFQHI